MHKEKKEKKTTSMKITLVIIAKQGWHCDPLFRGKIYIYVFKKIKETRKVL